MAPLGASQSSRINRVELPQLQAHHHHSARAVQGVFRTRCQGSQRDDEGNLQPTEV